MIEEKKGLPEDYSQGVFNTTSKAPPKLSKELEELESELGKKAHLDYRKLSWAERTFAFTLAWDQAQRKRLGSLKTYFASFEPRWLRPDWSHFNLARILADGVGVRYEDWIAFQIERTKAEEVCSMDLKCLHDSEALSASYHLFLPKGKTLAPQVRPLLRLWSKVDMVKEYEAMEMIKATGLERDEDSDKSFEEKLKALLSMATKDSVTGLSNSEAFYKSLNTEWERLVRLTEPLSLVICAIDEFTHFVDQRGLQAKNACLRLMAGMMVAELRRPADKAGYLELNEFALLLPHTPQKGAFVVAERIRRQMWEKGIVHPGVDSGVITASFGVSGLVPTVKSSLETIIKNAMSALNMAQANGGDQVRLAETV